LANKRTSLGSGSEFLAFATTAFFEAFFRGMAQPTPPLAKKLVWSYMFFERSFYFDVWRDSDE